MVIIERAEWEEDFEEAAKHAGISFEHARDAFDARMRMGRALYDAQDVEAARINFQEAVKEGKVAGLPADLLLPAMNNVDACSLRLGDYEEVLTSTERVLSNDNPKALLRRWLALVHQGKTVEAAQAVFHLESMSLNDDIRGRLDAYKQAIAAEEERQERNEKCLKLRVQGNRQMRLRQVDRAIELYTEALAVEPFDVPTSNNRAQAYLNLGRFEDAEKDATVALQTDRCNTKAAYRRAKARLGLPHPDKEGACKDLALVLSSEPESQEAKDLLAQTMAEMDLERAGVMKTEEHRGTCASVQAQHPGGEDASFKNETEVGDDSSCGAENIHQDKEVEPHPDAKKHPGSLVIIEDDNGEGGCSWCPVMPEERGKDGQVSEEHWFKGEEHRNNKNWAGAVESFTRGAVADPSNAACWIGLSRVHREQHSYRESFEAASRASKVAPTSPRALVCSALASLRVDTKRTEQQRMQFVQDVQQELNNMDKANTNKVATVADVMDQMDFRNEIAYGGQTINAI